ncbi:MAG TPA: cupredoxin family protein [Burkholderiales bacterium]
MAAFIATSAFGHGDEPNKPKPPASHDHSSKGDEHSAGKETAFGRPGDPAKVDRTIMVEMRDPGEFSPSEITVKAGETVRFVVVNAGKHMHEMVLGTMQELEEHHEMMKQQKDMHHDEPHMAHVGPGKSGVIVWQFTKPGEFFYACLVEDHFELGMYGKIRVAGAPASAGEEHPHGGHASGGHAQGDEMRGMYGPYVMARESSGTAWQPDASPHQGIHAMYGEWSTMTHGFVNLIYDRQGGPRGDKKTFSTSMLMVMAQRPAAGGTLGLRGMVSADPLMGKRGYPLLLQTGEAANGAPLIDRQHPHDLFMELAASYSRPLSERSSVFAYAGLPGEPALGPAAFMHRFSSEDNPEAPISHHWLDSTHITYGVVTLGYVMENIKLEGSVFRGREPDERRYDIETGKLDSASVRLSYNPTRDWALQVSRGRIKSPEELHPDADVDRTTASVIYHRAFGSAAMQTTLAWGRNSPNHGDATDTFLLESAVRFSRAHTVFGRAERADKNELFLESDPRAGEKFRVGKLTLGYVYDLPRDGHLKLGVGGLVSRYRLPSELAPVYGNPTSFMLFVRAKLI